MNLLSGISLLLLATDTVARPYETIQGRSCFRSMKGMMDSMFDLADDHPNLVTIADIGDSYLKSHRGRTDGQHEIPTGGHDIYALKIASSDGGRRSGERGKMLVTSGVHAREWAPPELLARFLELLVRGYGEDADVTWILQCAEIHAILYINPDGRWVSERYHDLYWRKNLNPDGGCEDDGYGVDINRNFDFMWGDRAGASHVPCAGDYHGDAPESEPETRALAEYAKGLFPEGQRKRDPKGEMDRPFGEDNTGMYIDIHSSGGYVYYPWGHRDAQSPDDEALQALGRKISSFNGYKLWAGGQPDFVYEASGDTSDYLYAVMGVASLGLEIGDDWYQDCRGFEKEVVPSNLPALVYAAKTALKPFKETKGPDILSLSAVHAGGEIRVTASASDGRMVNAIRGFPDFRTGAQSIAEVRLYLDIHPNDFEPGDASWPMRPAPGNPDSEDVESSTRAAERAVDSRSFAKNKRCRRAGGGRKCKWLRRSKTCVPAVYTNPTGDNTGSSADDTGSGPSDEGFASGDETSQLTNDAVYCRLFVKKKRCRRAGGSGKCEWLRRSKTCVPTEYTNPTGGNTGSSADDTGSGPSDEGSALGDETAQLTIDTSTLSPGRHALLIQATDSDGYKGPVSSVFIEVSLQGKDNSLRGAEHPKVEQKRSFQRGSPFD